MQIRPGSLVFVTKVPKSNAGAAKHPFCVVEVNSDYFVALPISTNLSKLGYTYNIKLEHWEESGLRKPSLVKCDFPLKCEHNELYKVFGMLSIYDAKQVGGKYLEFLRNGGRLMESNSLAITASALYKSVISYLNQIKAILSAIEFEELVVEAYEYDRLLQVCDRSEQLLKFLDGMPGQVRPKLSSDLQSIYNDLINSVNKYKEEI